MSAPSTSGLSVELLLRVIDVKYGCFSLLFCFRHKLYRAYPKTQADVDFLDKLLKQGDDGVSIPIVLEFSNSSGEF